MKAWFKDKLARLKADVAKAHKSMTIWFNSAMGFVIVALPYAQANLPQLQPYLPDGLYNHAMVVLVVGNIILRFKTRVALAAK